MEHIYTITECRLIGRFFGGRNAHRCESGGSSQGERRERKERPRTYTQGDKLREYIGKSQIQINREIDALLNRFTPKHSKRAGAEKFKKAFNDWIDGYNRQNRNNSKQLEEAFANAEKQIHILEKAVQQEGVTIERDYDSRAREFAERYAKENGLRGLPDRIRKNVFIVYLPTSWNISGLKEVPVSATEKETRHSVVVGRQALYFSGENLPDTVKVTVPFPDQSWDYDVNVIPNGDGTITFDTARITEDLNAAERKKEEVIGQIEDARSITATKEQEFKNQQRTDYEVKKKIPVKQQSAKTASEVHKSILDEYLALYRAWQEKAITEEHYQDSKKILEKKLDEGAQRIVRLMIEEAIRIVREGVNPKDMQAELSIIEAMFPEVYGGKQPDANEKFEAHPLIKFQLERKDLPYILKHEGGGKLVFVENKKQVNPKTGERVENQNARFNQRLAYVCLHAALHGKEDKNMKERVQKAAKTRNLSEEKVLAREIITDLKKDTAGKDLGVYLKDGNLREFDDTYFGTDEILMSGFEKSLQEDPVGTLKQLGELREKNVAEAKKARAFTVQADSRYREFDAGRRLLPKEIDNAIASITNMVTKLRKAVFKDHTYEWNKDLHAIERDALSLMNRLNKQDDYSSRRVNNALNESIAAPIVIEGGYTGRFIVGSDGHLNLEITSPSV